MGFHKRYVKKENILNSISDLDTLLSSEILIMDSWSNQFTNDLDPSERKLREKIKEDQKYSSSGCTDKHPDYPKLKSLSETLIGLMTNPTWLDIHFTKTKLNLQFPLEDSGQFEIQKNKCIASIIEYYDNLN
jgi:hypothetical protein